ncbi:glycosyltransferase [Microbulbifer pacificus]|uniref:glycosyltransferase n=1 Tax=Microbulbifer pacificus TaxID=407164 RepID=UPI000CF3FE51|nr:glycosyltransferase [Microbulbifer pacificus]
MLNQLKVTAIIPFKTDSSRPDLKERVKALAGECVFQGFSVIVVQHTENGEKPIELNDSIKKSVNLLTYSDNSIFNLSKARNIGLKSCDSEWCIFLDADLVLPKQFSVGLERLFSSNIVASETFFLTLPVVYVSENVPVSKLQLAENFGEFVCGDIPIDHWVLGSSVIVARSKYLKKLGGYCELYRGWGYEDHDMAMHLVSRDSTFITPRKSHLFDPRPMQSLSRYVGWRAKYALYGRLATMYNLFLLHAYHSKNTYFSGSSFVSNNLQTFVKRSKALVFPSFEEVKFHPGHPIYSQYHLFFEQAKKGRLIATIRDFLLRKNRVVRAYRKIMRIE